MPSLVDLDLTLGGETISVNILKAIARGPKLRSLTLNVKSGTLSNPLLQILRKENNPWPHLASLTIKIIGFPSTEEFSLETRPDFNLVQLTIENPHSGLCRWLLNDKSGLTHFSIIPTNGFTHLDDTYLNVPNLKNVRSLTFGRVSWNEQLFNTLHSLNRLKELRFSSSIAVVREFPGHIPDTIEHLTISVPLFLTNMSTWGSLLTSDRPALLQTCDFIHIDTKSESMVSMSSITWSETYGQLARDDGITVTYTDSQKKSSKLVLSLYQFHDLDALNPSATDLWLRNPFSSANMTDYKVPLYIQPGREEFHPSASQLDILGFEDILNLNLDLNDVLGRTTGNQTVDQRRVASRRGAASDKGFLVGLRSK